MPFGAPFFVYVAIDSVFQVMCLEFLQKCVSLQSNQKTNAMTAVELKTSINEDLNLLGVEMLEYVSKYVRRLAMRARNHQELLSASPRKVKISNRIRQMSGKFSVPSDIDIKALKAEMLEENTTNDEGFH